MVPNQSVRCSVSSTELEFLHFSTPLSASSQVFLKYVLRKENKTGSFKTHSLFVDSLTHSLVRFYEICYPAASSRSAVAMVTCRLKYLAH